MLKPNAFTNPIKILRARNGFGIIEVMVAAGLLLIISIGMTSLITNMQKEQRRQTLLQVLVSQKNRFENAILNTSSWANTITASGGTVNVNTYCLLNQVACSTITLWTGSYSTSYQTLILKDGTAGAATFYDGTGAAGSIQGFTESGTACNTFTTAAAGNDACPIGYRVSWAPQNIVSSNPKITVYAKMMFNPSDSNPFKTFLNASPSIATLNTKYDVAIDRTASASSKSFYATYTKAVSASGATISCSTGGFGTCSVGPTAAAFAAFGTGGRGTYTITAGTDPFGLVDQTVTTAVRLKNIGSYKCNAKSYAFGTDGAQLRVSRTNNTAAVVAGPVSGYASKTQYGYTTLILDSVIIVTQPNTDIVMEQRCDAIPLSGNDTTIGQCSLGFSGASYTPSPAEIATLNCILID